MADNLVDSVMQARKDKLDDPTVPQKQKPTGTLLDLLFNRRKQEEDQAKQVEAEEK